MDDAQWERIEAKRAQQAHFRALDEAAKKARFRPTPQPRAPRAVPTYRGGRRQVYTHCSDCGRPLRPRQTTLKERPGTVLNQGGGKCKPCFTNSPRRGMIGRPQKRSRVCKVCGRAMRMSSRENLTTHPGTVPYGKDDKCRTCSKRGA